MELNLTNEILVCKCDNVEHQLVFSWFTDEEMVYMSTHLCKLPFWQRLWHGIKYIFGYKSRYGDFDEFILRREDAEKLEKIVEHLKREQ